MCCELLFFFFLYVFSVPFVLADRPVYAVFLPSSVLILPMYGPTPRFSFVLLGRLRPPQVLFGAFYRARDSILLQTCRGGTPDLVTSPLLPYVFLFVSRFQVVICPVATSAFGF